MGLELFSQRIKELRTKIGITQKDFADAVHITTATLSSYENGIKKPSLSVLADIAERYTVSIDWLCGMSDIMDPGDTFRMYSDIIRTIIKIADSITTHVISEEINPILDATGIGFEDDVMKDFFSEWIKMKDLYYSNVIDEEVYKLWIEKTLTKYNKTIQPCNWKDLPGSKDSEIPFDK
ncbi:helix-turn-helix domain-containing protein [Clostridium sp. Marseille-P299]|uniref:helix-turn-helix domain-containing protein n=1 Tax=Clostridium sp. Marseille-P299 TaxID=1805477 RepID=UPI00082DAF59|nr:helix-turn-helix transcriptional regulator [Clostridium sp. Marseille-P299]